MKKYLKAKRLIRVLIIIVVVSTVLLTAYFFVKSKHSDEEYLKISSSKGEKITNDEVIDEPDQTEEEIEEEESDFPDEDIDTNTDEQSEESTTSPVAEPTSPPAQPQTQPSEQPAPAPTNWWSYPSVIEEIPVDQVSLNVVMNKSRKLSASYAPTDLVILQSMPGIRVNKTLYVRSIIVEPLRQLGAAAIAEGIDLSVISAYRSYATQQGTYQYWVNYNGGNVNAADQVSARPGHSEHQLGTTVDFSTSEIGDAIGSQFNSTKANSWLLNNAPRFGFKLSYPAGQETVTGFAHEGWHWRYNP